jgi:hypothetical protein
MRPVPLVPLTLRVRTIRPGRKVQWIEAAMLDTDEREVARDRAAAGRRRSTRPAPSASAPAPPPDAGGPHPRSSAPATPASGARTMCASCVGTGWSPARCRVVALALPGGRGESCRRARAPAAADFGSGVGNPLRFTEASGINADVTISLTGTRSASGSASSQGVGGLARCGPRVSATHDDAGRSVRPPRRCSSNRSDDRPSPGTLAIRRRA